jgi:hypothetical protein
MLRTAWLGTSDRGPVPSRSPRVARWHILLGLLALAAGLPGPAVAQIAAPSVSSVTFGLQPVGTSSAAKVIEIFNASNDPSATGFLQISSASLTGSSAFSVVAQTCFVSGTGYPLGPGAFCTITLGFAPTSAGSPTAVLSVVSNGSITPLQIAVLGTAVTPTSVVTITPSPLVDFGLQVTHVSTTEQLTVTNTTANQVTVNSAGVAGANVPSFTASSAACGTLLPGGQCTVSVTYTPQVADFEARATVVVYVSNDSIGNPNTASNNVMVQGGGLPAAPILNTNPETFNFGSVGLGSPDAAVMGIYNSGSAPLLISSINPEGVNQPSFFGSPASVANTCVGSPVPPAGSCTITITFSPTQVGLLTAYFNIVSNASNADAGAHLTRIDLSGTGVANTAHATFSPPVAEFGLQPTGTTSARQLIYLTNTTAAPLPLTSGSVALGGANAPSFTLNINSCTSTLAVGDECVLEASFTPGQGLLPPGVPLSAYVSVNGYAQLGQGTLTGYGVSPTPSVTVTPAALTFGPQVVGTVSASQTLTVTNTTNKAAVKVSSVSFGGNNGTSFGESSLCGGAVALAPGGTCTINVTFQPQQAPPPNGALSAALNIGDSVGGPVSSVSLSGTGTLVTLPSIAGDSLAKARATLTALGYEVRGVTTDPSGKPVGQVLSQTATGSSYGSALDLAISAGPGAVSALTTERALAQAGLSVGLASNLLQSQSQIISGVNNGIPFCTPLGSAGSVWSQGPPSAVWVYSDNACSHPYIQATATPLAGGEISETAIYYGLGTPLTQVGTLTFTVSEAPTGSQSVGITGSGTFTVTGTGQTVQLGLYCVVPAIITLPCAGGIVQNNIDGMAIGSLIPLAMDGLSFAGIGSSEYIGPTGSLTLTNPGATSPPFMDITGSAVSFESFSTYGAVGSFTLFPPPPTGWTVMDSSGNQLQITESATTASFSLNMTVPGTSGATGTVDTAGNGSITYSDGTNATIANWILSN